MEKSKKYQDAVDEDFFKEAGDDYNIDGIAFHPYGGNASTMGSFYDNYKDKGVEILEGHLMPDHIHMLVSIPPKISVSSFMGYLKGKSSLMIFDKHANLKYKFGNRKFWAEGYYVSTVGLNEATIRKYIQQQEKHDILQDKLSTREYQDPFKG